MFTYFKKIKLRAQCMELLRRINNGDGDEDELMTELLEKEKQLKILYKIEP